MGREGGGDRDERQHPGYGGNWTFNSEVKAWLVLLPCPEQPAKVGQRDLSLYFVHTLETDSLSTKPHWDLLT